MGRALGFIRVDLSGLFIIPQGSFGSPRSLSFFFLFNLMNEIESPHAVLLMKNLNLILPSIKAMPALS